MSTPVASLPVAVPTMTLGRAWIHDLDVKIAEARNAGFQGLEIFWDDLVCAAKRINPTSTEKDEAAMLRATRYTKELCDTNGLVVMALQPFLNYDGVLDETKHQEHITKLKLWFKVAKILGTDLIQVPSQMNLEGTTGNFDKIVADIREIGELGLQEDPPIRFAYEALAWGAHLDLWQQVWAVVIKVDLPNVGTVLDTYHVLIYRIGFQESHSDCVLRSWDESTAILLLQPESKLAQKKPLQRPSRRWLLRHPLFCLSYSTFNSRTLNS